MRSIDHARLPTSSGKRSYAWTPKSPSPIAFAARAMRASRRAISDAISSPSAAPTANASSADWRNSWRTMPSCSRSSGRSE